jgi:serine/threonine protein kinase
VRQVCLQCERTAQGRNLYCQETFCPAERSPLLLDQGEWLGDIEIVRLIVVLRSAALYMARYQGHMVLLKVAHPDPDHISRLKREAAFLASLEPQPATHWLALLRLRRRGADVPLALPRLLPAYADVPLEKAPYGKTMLADRLLYFCMYAHFDGESLRAVLMRQSQPWLRHTGSMMIDLASTIAHLQRQDRLHVSLCPESLLVRFEKAPYAPRILLIDLGIATSFAEFDEHWYPACVAPAYTAPELLSDSGGPQPVYETDVYSIGLLLYELLVGTPRFPSRLNSAAQIYRAVLEPTPPVERGDAPTSSDLSLLAISLSPQDRPAAVNRVRERLLAIYGPPRRRPRGWMPSQAHLWLVIIALLAVAFLVAVTVSFGQTFAAATPLRWPVVLSGLMR